jgi:hypothetical protein
MIELIVCGIEWQICDLQFETVILPARSHQQVFRLNQLLKGFLISPSP